MTSTFQTSRCTGNTSMEQIKILSDIKGKVRIINGPGKISLFEKFSNGEPVYFTLDNLGCEHQVNKFLSLIPVYIGRDIRYPGSDHWIISTTDISLHYNTARKSGTIIVRNP